MQFPDFSAVKWKVDQSPAFGGFDLWATIHRGPCSSCRSEIDLVIQDGRTLHPVEVKTGALVRPDAVKSFACLEGMQDYEVGFGQVICQTDEPYPVTRDVQAVPVWAV